MQVQNCYSQWQFLQEIVNCSEGVIKLVKQLVVNDLKNSIDFPSGQQFSSSNPDYYMEMI